MGKEKPLLNVRILSEGGVLFEGAVKGLLLPYEKEEVAILPQHTPIIAVLSPGNIKIVDTGEPRVIVSVKSGIVYVGDDEAIVLTNT
jgi:F0F1-type ATP synthase epsilon subunit